MKNPCVGLRPAPPLAEARVTQLAIASFREQITSPKLEARMSETLVLGGGAMEVLHTRHLLYMSSYFSETSQEVPTWKSLF